MLTRIPPAGDPYRPPPRALSAARRRDARPPRTARRARPLPRPLSRPFPPRRSPRLRVRRVRCVRRVGTASPVDPRPTPADPTTGVPRSLFCFGLGYTSLGLVNVLKRAGWTVSGTCRDDSRAESLASAGIDAHVWRPDDHLRLDRDGVAALAAATHVLASVPPVADFDRDPVLTDARCVDVLARSENLRWLGYLSSTGVYGDKLGAWVDEDEPAEPLSPKSVARLDAERAWFELATRHTLPLKIFRLGGIYGPGRSILDAVAAKAAARARGGVAAESRSQRARKSRGYTSRCHVADIVATICASVDAGDETEIGRVYNVADDEPAPRGEAAAFAAKLLGVASDRRRESDGEGDGGGGAERARGEKRVRNDRIKVELGVELLFPTYREGLAAIAEGNRTPFGRDGGERA